MNKIFAIGLVIALVFGIVGIFTPKADIEKIVQIVIERLPVGGLIHNVIESFDEGIAVENELVITGEGSFIERGNVYDFGEIASTTVTAEMICPGTDKKSYNFFKLDGDGKEDDVGVSLSFSDDETFVALDDCVENQGDRLRFVIDPTSSTSTTYLDIVTSEFITHFASSQKSDWNGERLILVEIINVDGTSLSFNFDSVEASLSYQP